MCINSVRKVIEENPQIDLEVPLECVLEALEITMSSNNGSFANNFFTQFNGATIGGPESASVTDIFGAVYIDPVAKNGGSFVPKDWKRYRNDTWDLEDHVSEQQLETFAGYLNSNVFENKIKFTRETSKNELVFLETKVHLKDGFLISEIYSKPTDSHEYLNPRSCHPPQVTRNNPNSVALRIRRNCSDRVPGDKMFINNLVKYKAYLLDSSYASDTIDKHFIKVAKLKRKDTLGEKVARNRESGNRKINFVTTWDPMFPDINKLSGNFIKFWKRTNSAKNYFLKGRLEFHIKEVIKYFKEFLAPSRVVFENTDALSPSKRQHHGKCAKCETCGKSTKGRRRNSGIYCCHVLKENNQFKSFQTKEQYRIRQDINCKSENVIYLFTCKMCGLQGVGSCLVLSQRVSNYITSIKKRKPGCKIEQHFTRPGHTINDYSVLGIVKLENPPRDPTGRLREFEGYWMIKLNEYARTLWAKWDQ